MLKYPVPIAPRAGSRRRHAGLYNRCTSDEGGHVTHLRRTIDIAASPDAVWEVLGDLSATTEWLPGTVDSRMDGAVRTCVMADGNETREEISEYEPERRTYRYRHLQVPLPVSDSAGTFVVEAAGGGSTVVLEAEFQALDPAAEPELEAMFGGTLEQALESLRRRVEQGALWQTA
jgi:uncharacterized protein YndB with AHSA1/START domain